MKLFVGTWRWYINRRRVEVVPQLKFAAQSSASSTSHTSSRELIIMDAFAELVDYLSTPTVTTVGGDVASVPTNEEDRGTGNNAYCVVA